MLDEADLSEIKVLIGGVALKNTTGNGRKYLKILGALLITLALIAVVNS